jgi:aromatic-L-amino-acid/L-tryptophan decarboxylase
MESRPSRNALDQKLDLAQTAHRALRATPNLELLGPPDLSIIALRCRVPCCSSEDDNRATLKLVEQVDATGHAFLSSARIHKQVFAGIAIQGLRTDAEQVATAVTAIQHFANQLVTSASAPSRA